MKKNILCIILLFVCILRGSLSNGQTSFTLTGQKLFPSNDYIPNNSTNAVLNISSVTIQTVSPTTLTFKRAELCKAGYGAYVNPTYGMDYTYENPFTTNENFYTDGSDIVYLAADKVFFFRPKFESKTYEAFCVYGLDKKKMKELTEASLKPEADALYARFISIGAAAEKKTNDEEKKKKSDLISAWVKEKLANPPMKNDTLKKRAVQIATKLIAPDGYEIKKSVISDDQWQVNRNYYDLVISKTIGITVICQHKTTQKVVVIWWQFGYEYLLGEFDKEMKIFYSNIYYPVYSSNGSEMVSFMSSTYNEVDPGLVK
jgi:hypothetical protein